MKIRVLLFGPQAVMRGEPAVELDLAGDRATAAEVLHALGDLAPELADSLAASRLAVNHEFASTDQAVLEGDEVALIGMVSGG